MVKASATFSPSFGNRPKAFVGREEVIRDFVDGMEEAPGGRKRAMFFSGQRGMGKTALLLELAARAEKMDFVTASVLANARMLDEIIQLIQMNGATYVSKSSKQVKAINVGVPGFSFGLTFSDEVKENYGFRVKLTLLCDALAKYGKGVLLLIDEVYSGTEEIRELAATYQHLVGEGKNVAIAMAGLPSAISGVLNDKALTFLNRASKIRLDPIPLGAISVYYSSVFKKLGKEIAPKLLEEAVAATRGYPYLLQLVGYYLLEYTGEGAVITDDDVRLAVNSAKHDLIENVYLASLRPLSRNDIRFLEAMAESGEDGRIADIRERMEVSQATAQQYRLRLIESGVVASSARGELEFTIPYMGEYLRGEMAPGL
jgi:hypothetical protein